MTSLGQKVAISMFSSVIFFIFNLPETYNFVGKLLSLKLVKGLCPTNIGLLLHAFLFCILSFFMMGDPRKDTSLKLKYSFYGTLIFYLVSSPALYGVTNKLFQNMSTNCPNKLGILLHSVVYCLLLIGVVVFLTI